MTFLLDFFLWFSLRNSQSFLKNSLGKGQVPFRESKVIMYYGIFLYFDYKTKFWVAKVFITASNFKNYKLYRKGIKCQQDFGL
jgi:hypothetical protein